MRRLVGLGWLAGIFGFGYVLLNGGPSAVFQIGGTSGYLYTGLEVLLGSALLVIVCTWLARQIQRRDAIRALEEERRRRAAGTQPARSRPTAKD